MEAVPNVGESSIGKPAVGGFLFVGASGVAGRGQSNDSREGKSFPFLINFLFWNNIGYTEKFYFLCISFFSLKFFFTMVDLQCSVNFCYTAK